MENQIADRIAELFEPWDRDNRPGGGVVVARDGEPVFARTYGLADLDRSEPFTSSHLTSIASCTKVFTGAVILMLMGEGRLRPEDDIREYIPELYGLDERVSIAQLCHHSSGIKELLFLGMLLGAWPERLIDSERSFHLVTGQRTLNFTPGTRFSYSNSNYALLSWIIERVTGSSFNDALTEYLFAPLGMDRTLVLSDSTRRPKHGVEGYIGDAPGVLDPAVYAIDGMGFGGMWSTIDDMTRWLVNLQTEAVGGSGFVSRLSRTSELNDGSPNTYAFGVNHSQYRGLPWLVHAGEVPGFRSAVIHFPEQRLGIFTCANHMLEDPGLLGIQVADLFLDRFGAEPRPEDREREDSQPASMPVPPGWFQDPETGAGATLIEMESRPVLEILGTRVPLMADNAGGFRQAPGAPVALVANFDGDRLTAVVDDLRVELSRAPEASGGVAEFAGTYRSDELGAAYQVIERDGELEATCDSAFGPTGPFPLLRKARDSFLHGGIAHGGAVMHFERDDDDEVTGFVACCNTATGIRFRRETDDAQGERYA